MDGQPLLLLFSVHVVYHISTARRCGKPAPFFPPCPAAGFNSRAFIQKHMGSGCPESRRGSIPQGALFDSKHHRFKTLMHLVSAAKRARKREKLSIGRSGTNRAHKSADGKTMADEKTQLGRHIRWHTVIFGADTPRRRGLTPRAAFLQLVSLLSVVVRIF